jgi:predicted PurR-regulated permease PerM
MKTHSPREAGPLVWLVILAVTCLLIFAFQKILWLVIPFIFAVILHVLLLPLVTFLVLRGLSHEKAVLAVITLLAVGLGLAGMVLFTRVLAQSMSWQDNLAGYFQQGARLLSDSLLLLEKKVSFLRSAELSAEVTEQVNNFTSQFAKKYAGEALVSFLHWVPSLLLVPYLTYFFLLDGVLFKKFVLQAVPNAFFEKTLLLIHRVSAQVKHYLQGLMMLTLLDAITLGLGLWLLGFHNPILLGIITAILAWLPYIGSILGCILVVLVAATDFPDQTWIAYGAVGVFLFARLLDDFIYMPMTIGRSLRIHPLVTVLMLFVGGAVAGATGLFLVMPVLGVVLVIGEIAGQVLTDERLKARHAYACQLRRTLAQSDFQIPTPDRG